MMFFALVLAFALAALASGCGSDREKGKNKDLGKLRQGGDVKVSRAADAPPQMSPEQTGPASPLFRQHCLGARLFMTASLRPSVLPLSLSVALDGPRAARSLVRAPGAT